MARTGQRLYRCQDCGATRWLWPEARNVNAHKKTDKDHCSSCGSTFLEPASPRAAEETETLDLRANRGRRLRQNVGTYRS